MINLSWGFLTYITPPAPGVLRNIFPQAKSEKASLMERFEKIREDSDIIQKILQELEEEQGSACETNARLKKEIAREASLEAALK